MADGIRIDALPTTVAPNPNHVVPAMHDGIAVRLSLAQILALGRIATTLADGTDFDTITSNGVFILTSNVNAPATGGRWLVWSIVDPADTGRVFHQAMLISGGTAARVYTRRSASGVFGPWSGGTQASDIGWDNDDWFSDKENVEEVIVAIGEWLYALDRGVGDIYPVTRTTLRDNELKANGALLSRASYPELWAHAQSSGLLVTEANWSSNNQGSFSSGDGLTTFRIPDLRGEFLRGWDDGRGVDSGRGAGTAQGFAIQAHTHTGAIQGGSAGPFTSGPSGGGFSSPTGSTGGSETRPRNLAYLYVIRFR